MVTNEFFAVKIARNDEANSMSLPMLSSKTLEFGMGAGKIPDAVTQVARYSSNFIVLCGESETFSGISFLATFV